MLFEMEIRNNYLINNLEIWWYARQNLLLPLGTTRYVKQTSFTKSKGHRLHFLGCNLRRKSNCYAIYITYYQFW